MTAPTSEEVVTEDADCAYIEQLFKSITGVDVVAKTVNGKFIITDPCGQEFKTGLVRKQ